MVGAGRRGGLELWLTGFGEEFHVSVTSGWVAFIIIEMLIDELWRVFVTEASISMLWMSMMGALLRTLPALGGGYFDIVTDGTCCCSV